jgi:hypothetical protein
VTFDQHFNAVVATQEISVSLQQLSILTFDRI